MNFVEAIKSAFANYANFEGRAIRSEYWWFSLLVSIVNTIAEAVVNAHDQVSMDRLIAVAISLALVIPSIAVGFRRMHDNNRSGWWLLLSLTIIGIPVVLYWLIKKGTNGPNRFGEDRLAALSAAKTADVVT